MMAIVMEDSHNFADYATAVWGVQILGGIVTSVLENAWKRFFKNTDISHKSSES
jgi:hypothetical protein